MRRLALAAALAVALAGCGGGEEVAPVAETVEGEAPQTQPVAQGDPAAGKTVYNANGCGSCHAFEPAGSTAKVGPALDELEESAEEADQGTVEEYARTSIVNPNAYVREGYQPVMPPFRLEDEQLADLVAFITQGD